MKTHPFILGRGKAGQAIAKSLDVLRAAIPELDIQSPVFLRRDQGLEGLSVPRDGASLLFIANPHSLHARAILDGERAGFAHIVCEKPACTSLSDLGALATVRAKVALCHVYRQMWGPSEARRAIEAGELGELVAIEGRHWSSSVARKPASPAARPAHWKNDPELSGGRDTLFDLGSHWVDLAHFLAGRPSSSALAWLTNAGADAPHRDTHVQLSLAFGPGLCAYASLSKIAHGASECLEFDVLGTKGSLHWSFASPDEIRFGSGAETRSRRREEPLPGSRLGPGHGLGWHDGYVDIAYQSILAAHGRPSRPVPTLAEGLDVMRVLLSIP
jgi:predicted dehydrogenase